MLGTVEVVPHPLERSPKASFRPSFGIIVEGHFHDFVELVVQRWNRGGVVVWLGVGHALHEWFGGVHGFPVRPNDCGLEINAACFK